VSAVKVEIRGEAAAFLVVLLQRPVVHSKRGYVFRARMIMPGNAAADRTLIFCPTRHRRRAELAHPDGLAARHVRERDLRALDVEDGRDIGSERHVAPGPAEKNALELPVWPGLRQVDAVGRTALDVPRQQKLADPVGRITARRAVQAPAGAHRLAVAGLVVTATDQLVPRAMPPILVRVERTGL